MTPTQAPTGLYPIARGKRQRRPGSWSEEVCPVGAASKTNPQVRAIPWMTPSIPTHMPPQQLTIQELAAELITLRQQSQAIHEREQILRDEMLARLENSPEPRFSTDSFDFSVIPSTQTQRLSEPLLRIELEKLGLGPEAVAAAIEAAAKPSTRNSFLRITPKRPWPEWHELKG